MDLSFLQTIEKPKECDLTFINACKSKNLEEVKRIYVQDPSVLNIVDSDGLNACMYSTGDVLDFILTCKGVDIFRYDSTGKTLYDILRQKGTPTDKLKLLRSNKKSSRITNVPVLHEIKANDLKNILLFDDLESFKTSEECKDDILLLACQLKAWDIVKFLLNEADEKKLTYVSEHRFTPLCYVFFYEKDDIAETMVSLLNGRYYKSRNIFNELSVMYGETCIKMKYDIINSSSNEDVDVCKTQFKMDNFTTVQFNSTLDIGVSCSTLYVTDKKTNKEYLLKKIEKIDLKGTVMKPDNFQEINIHRFINSIDENVAIKIYGYFIHDGSLFLVLEPAFCTLHTYINILKKDKQLFHTKIKEILYSICKLLDGIASIGVIHRDMKTNNIMIDRNGKLKLIDFGLSQFIGLSMSISLSENILPVKYIYPPDRVGDISLKMINGTVRKFRTNRKTLNIDSYGIGVNLLTIIVNEDVIAMMSTMFNDTRNGRPQTFISDHESIYATNNRDRSYESDNLWYSFNVTWLKDFNDHDQLYDLFKWMICSNSEIRSFGKNCLLHPYFTGSKPVWNSIEQCLPITRYSLVSYNGDTNFEACYRKEMIDNFSKISNYPFSLSEEREDEDLYFKTIIFIFNLFSQSKSTSIDVLFNFIGKFRMFIDSAKGTFNKSKINETYILFAIVIYTLTDIQYEDTLTLKGEDIVNRCIKLSGYKYDSELICHTFDIIRNSDYIFKMVPVQTMITSIIIDLKKKGFQTRDVEDRMSTLIIKVQAYITVDVNPWKLMTNILHYLLPIDEFSFIESKDPIIHSMINEVVFNYEWLSEYKIKCMLT